MQIIVFIKQTFDTEAKISLDASGKIDAKGIKYITNPYDEFAVEEALRIKERLGTGEVIVVSLGGDNVQEQLRQALAMGADEAILVASGEIKTLDEHIRAVILAAVAKKIGFDLIIGGNMAIDDGSAQVMTRVAERLDLPQVNQVTKLNLEKEKMECWREVDGNREILLTKLPCLVTTQKGINEPRYPSMKGIMQAKKKVIRKIKAAELELDLEQLNGDEVKSVWETIFLPAGRKQGKIIGGEFPATAFELVRILHEEAKVV
ncbi:electron transfer flavoprotein subunit beta/FixA family protein [Candidatus Formimonas warabiya]|uniref:Electron transfer flavoprotein subunit beta n=1 Tax=Formimonas warabiya TaxID=1761012 RepID=A0A3G1L0P6_FORW1|nr:electron transfer flavoprotein subunit beta/FixA family protein [Candidatus Formimonas warabiya]ATW28055.1 electron transfer flavoprotein subunit beta [Candidatus Formimonas warabiya]